MLHSTPRPGLPRERDDVLLHSEPDYISFLDIARFLRRGRVVICCFVLAAIGLAVLYSQRRSRDSPLARRSLSTPPRRI